MTAPAAPPAKENKTTPGRESSRLVASLGAGFPVDLLQMASRARSHAFGAVASAPYYAKCFPPVTPTTDPDI